MKMQRSAGILLPISSLPSPYGIGCFSQEAYDFADWLKEAGQTYWQILPLGVTSYGDSPYQSFSAFAGNPYFISLDALVEEGVLTAAECKKANFGRKADDINYSRLYTERGRLLRLAYSRSDIGHNEAFVAFCEKNKWWLDDFALFMAVKDRFEGKPWIEWAEDIRLRWQPAMDYYRRELYFEVEYHKYLQFKFDERWRGLKAYANSKGIRIIGDIPIYVALDSADAWANPGLFQLDQENLPTAVAGVPPDGFSPTGQLWGNPLYRWEAHRETGYQWWITRLWYCFELYDVVRMPHYYKITQGHGQGAELVMDAEAAFMQGHFERAVLLLERARVRAASRGQENMALCCDFLALRLSLCGQAGEPFDFEARRAALLQQHDAVLLHLLESIEAYYYALLGRTDAVPEVFREHRLASVSYFALCRPMMEMIELQVWLAQGQAVKVLARCEELLAACQRFHYGLVALYVRVQMAAAYGLYGQPAEARAALEQALAEAAPDGFWMPLAENYRYLAPLLAQGGWGSAQPLVERAIALGQRYEARRAQLNGSADRPAIAAALTEKELALARLVAQRRTNKEIAETLHLSEGTVKQYINQLYAKLDIGGAVRNKRAQLAALFGTKY